MVDLTLHDLVRNGTMSPDMAATLALAGAERRSLLFVAIPRLAGKTTTLLATLRYTPDGTSVHSLSRLTGPTLGIPDANDGGYLLMAEISPAGYPEYLWDEDVRHVFRTARGAGWPIATALHAGSMEAAVEVITRENGVPDADAACLDLVVYMRSFGPWQAPVRRVVETVHEVTAVQGGRAVAQLLHRWDDANDRFVNVEPATWAAGQREARARLLASFTRL